MNEREERGVSSLPVDVQPLGDAAFVVTFARELSETANDQVIALAASLAARRPDGILDIVPAMASLTVHVVPGRPDPQGFAAELQSRAAIAMRDARGASAPVTHEIPVVYGGAGGPDLAEVAAFAGCGEAEVAARHASRVYRVYMLGFLPGFAYLGDVDPSIAAPRRATPRQSVPAGSVGIAGRQTGVYPQASPGGWQLIGRTDVRLFDPASGSRLQPGDRVRFVATDVR